MPSEPEVTAAAKRALFIAGLELPGRQLQLFVTRLLSHADESASASPRELVATAISGLETDPVAVVAEEPELRDLVLPRPGRTVSEAAEEALHALGEQLVIAYRRASPSDSRPHLLQHLDEQARALADMTTASEDDMAALIAIRDQVFVIRETLATLGVPHATSANDAWNREIGSRA
jgi:hypothetical protein